MATYKFPELNPAFGVEIVNPMRLGGVDTIAIEKGKNPLVIYHGNCADGFGAAWCFHNVQDTHEVTYDFHPGVYGGVIPDCTGRVVYLVDFSYRRNVVKEICKVAAQVCIIDHHKTAIDDLAGIDKEVSNILLYTDLERSGAMLAWDFLHNTQFGYSAQGMQYVHHPIMRGHPAYVYPPLLLDHIQDRDLWKFKLPNTREIQANLFSYEYTFEQWDELMRSDQTRLLQMSVAGAAIERKHFKDIKELLAVCQRKMCFKIPQNLETMAVTTYCVPVANLPYTLASDAGNIMAKEYHGGRIFAATYIDTATERIFSLRSAENGVDVSEIAKAFGGGGHKHAAGFKVPRDHELARS